MVDLSAWPERSRLIVRRERPHPGAQLSFTDHDGYRFHAILTDQDDAEIAALECRHRQHAHVEDRIRDDKDTGLRLAGAPVLFQAPARPLATFGSLDESMPIRRSTAASGPGVPDGRCSLSRAEIGFVRSVRWRSIGLTRGNRP